MLRTFVSSLFCLLFVASTSVVAQTPSTPASASPGAQASEAVEAPIALPGAARGAYAAEEQEVATRLRAKYPNLTEIAVSRLPLGDAVMYEFLASGLVGYTNRQVDFVLMGGELIAGSGDGVRNVSRERAASAATRVVQGLPWTQALVFRYGTGQNRLAIFSDPDCPFCRELERLLASAPDRVNATVYVFPYPLSTLHPKADERARTLMCATDPNAAWAEWMLRSSGDDVSWNALVGRLGSPSPQCERAAVVDLSTQVGRALGFNTTPTMLFDNGMTWTGMITLDELEKAFAYAAANPHQPMGRPAAAPTQ